MLSATQFEILDIRHFNGRQLRPLLEHEAVAWENRLRWDYRNATELLLSYLDSHVLPGFVALDRGKVCGFSFCVYEGQKAVIGDAYAVKTSTRSPSEITRTLLVHLLEMLVNAPNICRVESQLLLMNEGTNSSVFAAHGFTSFARLFMECDLTVAPDLQELERLPGNLHIREWAGGFYDASAELIRQCYLGHIDSRINDQYRSLAGSLRFLHNIVRFPGCGVFEPSSSWVLLDGIEGKLVGLVLCSRVAPRVAHITQLCISPKYRGLGLGKAMMRHSMKRLLAAGFEAITLTVTEANDSAVRLYEDMAFTSQHHFDAMVLEKTNSFAGLTI